MSERATSEATEVEKKLLMGMHKSKCTRAMEAADLLGLDGNSASRIGKALTVLGRLVNLGLARRMDEARPTLWHLTEEGDSLRRGMLPPEDAPVAVAPKSPWDCLAENGSGHDLAPGAACVVADNVTSALFARSRKPLDEAAAALERGYLRRLRSAPAAAADAARGKGDASSPEAAAFALGQISMAHAIIAPQAARRADDDFAEILLQGPSGMVARALKREDLTPQELADRLGITTEVVSTALRLLQMKGAVDYRSKGKRVVRFLTPAATAVLEAEQIERAAQGRR